MKKKPVIIGIVALICLSAIFWFYAHEDASKEITIRYGITPYQDSALPVVAQNLGWYKEAGIKVEMVPVTWGEVVNALMGNAIDVSIYNFNSFQPPYENASRENIKPVFYCPVFLFKGQAIMVNTKSGMEVFRDKQGESSDKRETRIARVATQLKGKRIAVTKGTELEQIVIAALAKAGLNQNDVVIIHASPEDCLAAFLSGNIDAFAAGLTERIQARRHGATELLVTSDLMLPVVDGIVTTDKFATDNPELMNKLVSIWFRTIQFMENDLKKNSVYIRDYLAKKASARLSADEYLIAWSFDVFPKDVASANKLFNDPKSPYYWKLSWDANNKYLLAAGKVKKPVPYEAYWGARVLNQLAR